MGATRSNVYPLLPLAYGAVLFPGKTLHISPQDRQDVIALIAKYYSGAFTSRTKDNAPLITCTPLKSPYLSADGKRLIDDATKDRVSSPEPEATRARQEDLFGYGCVARITGVRGGRRGDVALVVDGFYRCKIDKVTSESPYFEAQVTEFKDVVDVWDPAVKGAFSHLKELSRELFQIVRVSSLVSRNAGMSPLLVRQLEAFVERKDVSEAGFLADFMAVLGQSSYEDRLWMLSATSVVHRLQRANELVHKQISTLQSNTQIITVTNDSRSGIDLDRLRELQKRQQSGKPIGMPPGFSLPPGMGGAGNEEDGNEVEELKKKLDEAGLSSEAQRVATRELKRLQKMNPAQAEFSVIRNYLENLAEIPWSKFTEGNLDAATLRRARQQLDDDHYGLGKIKKRLLEYLAVLKLKQSANAELEAQIKAITDKQVRNTEKGKDQEHEKELSEHDAAELKSLGSKRKVDKSPILLLVGPPGTGKTSLAKSVATALGRKFHRLSLGGVRDEAEIRGHRRTYVAAMPGLIVSGLKKVGVSNPVFLLDEIDKVSSSNFHGDPSAAMLEVLDPEQNHAFNDHYVNIPIDLSKVLFIATANTLDTIPPPLLDRMETIALSGYTTVEKRHIAMRHLIPKQIVTNGLQPGHVNLTDDVVEKIITGYTRESGVRNLEREIGSVCRYKAVQWTDREDQKDESESSKLQMPPEHYSPNVQLTDLEEILGIERFTEELASTANPPKPGVVTGLVAFSTLGQGSILFIEIADMPGTGRVQLTGKLGDVLKESVEVALSWVKAHAFDLSLTHDPNDDIMARRGIHVHCPAGAIPKDGPSAGLAHVIALVSLFTGKSVPATLAMTGEVSLRGRVMPVGGIKEKLIGALRAGVKVCMLPAGNRKEVKEVPDEVKEGMDIVFVEWIWEALRVVWPGERWLDGAGRRWEVESRL